MSPVLINDEKEVKIEEIEEIIQPKLKTKSLDVIEI